MSESRDSWCIVALPSEDDLTHKVSSEKVAHMTLLFLGEQTDSDLAIRILETLQHTVKQVFPHKFGMMVDRRGKLGEDQADVLFFEKFGNKGVHNLRNMLLKNDDIKKCYDSTDQFPEWTPHLTLGYPENPAKPFPRDQSAISYVHFDRIALWLADSDGPEIDLGREEYDSVPTPEDAYHGELPLQNGSLDYDLDSFLEHHGVKGMKWGKRKAEGSSSSSGSSSKESRKEYRARVKQEKSEFYNKKMSSIVDKASKDGDDVMIKTLYAGETYQTVTTGSDFVKQLSKGRAFDVTLTEVYATKTADGPYQMTGDRNVYQKSKRRK